MGGLGTGACGPVPRMREPIPFAREFALERERADADADAAAADAEAAAAAGSTGLDPSSEASTAVPRFRRASVPRSRRATASALRCCGARRLCHTLAVISTWSFSLCGASRTHTRGSVR